MEKLAFQTYWAASLSSLAKSKFHSSHMLSNESVEEDRSLVE